MHVLVAYSTFSWWPISRPLTSVRSVARLAPFTDPFTAMSVILLTFQEEPAPAPSLLAPMAAEHQGQCRHQDKKMTAATPSHASSF